MAVPDQSMQTFFAPAPRASRQEIERQHVLIRRVPFVPQILNAQPNLAALLNKHRQIVFANDAWLPVLNLSDTGSILGKRPGEAMGCINCVDAPAGCGTADACAFCGAVLAYLDAQKGKTAAAECRITARQGDQQVSFDFLVCVTPFRVLKEDFSILVATDISHEKRRRSLERIFFHDIANTAGALLGYSELLQKKSSAETSRLSGAINRAAGRLMQEIDAQRQLLEAENNELSPRLIPLSSGPFLRQLVKLLEGHEAARDRRIELDATSCDVQFISDPVLLGRALTNLIKNALEAEEPGAVITLGCRQTEGRIEFWMQNPYVMPPEVQLQVFHRSFSTKGDNRGLGTYGAKLLTERYLGGKVTFASQDGQGTVFRVILPLIHQP